MEMITNEMVLVTIKAPEIGQEEKKNNELGVELKRKWRRKPAKDPSEPRCSFWIVGKNRHCRLIPMRQSTFCAEHFPADGILPPFITKDGEKIERRREECPFGKHTFFSDQREAHFEKCNEKPRPLPEYVQSDINVIDCVQLKVHKNEVLTPAELGWKEYSYDLPDAEYSDLIRDIISIRKRDVTTMRERFGAHPIVGCKLVRSDIGHDAARHLAQIGSIIKILEDDGLLKDGTCFVEFGSGRGTLTYYIGLAVLKLGLQGCSFVLVDLTSPRHKQDNKLKDTGLKIYRVRADIRDIVLSDLPGVKSSETKHVVGVAKHLCGEATDLALFCLFNKANPILDNVAGAVMATCCHHRCGNETFVGREFVKRKFPPCSFPVLARVGAWGTDGDTKSQIDTDRPIKDEHTLFYKLLKKSIPDLYSRNRIGIFVKETLDFGRAKFVETESGDKFYAECVKYVDLNTTLENTAIVVTRPNSQKKVLRLKQEEELRSWMAGFKEILRSHGLPAGLNRVF